MLEESIGGITAGYPRIFPLLRRLLVGQLFSRSKLTTKEASDAQSDAFNRSSTSKLTMYQLCGLIEVFLIVLEEFC